MNVTASCTHFFSAFSDNKDILAEKDIEWCKENLLTEEYGQINEQIDPSKRKSSRKENEKVSNVFFSENKGLTKVFFA